MTMTWKMVRHYGLKRKGELCTVTQAPKDSESGSPIWSGLLHIIMQHDLSQQIVLSVYGFSAPVFFMLYQVYTTTADYLLSNSHATQLCSFLKASFPWSVTAEHCISDHSFHTIPIRCCSNWTIDMESNQSLVPVNIMFYGMLITSMFRYVANLQHQFSLGTICCAIF
jgi:hypothetical protein